MNIIIKKSSKKNVAHLFADNQKIKCFVGKNGIGNKRREGDFVTPAGIFKITKVFYRYDKIGKIKTRIKSQKILKKHIWNTDSKTSEYNKICMFRSRHNFEFLFRKDDLYDLILVLNFNMKPTKKFKGSAIFIHCSGNKRFTEGCVAVKKKTLIKMLGFISPYSLVRII